MRHALEPFDRGTREVAHKAAELTAAGNLVTVAGGGDTDAALTSGARGGQVHLCLDGRRRVPGVVLEGKELPGIVMLQRGD